MAITGKSQFIQSNRKFTSFNGLLFSIAMFVHQSITISALPGTSRISTWKVSHHLKKEKELITVVLFVFRYKWFVVGRVDIYIYILYIHMFSHTHKYIWYINAQFNTVYVISVKPPTSHGYEPSLELYQSSPNYHHGSWWERTTLSQPSRWTWWPHGISASKDFICLMFNRF